jgi:tetratricopeptide (TPR) repeat protein
MKLLARLLAILAVLALPVAANDAAGWPAKLYPGMTAVHHPIATDSVEAQQFFDQGLTLVYGFNDAEAIRSFRRAAQLDPKSPMPHWGIALALGPNINRPTEPAAEREAYEEIRKAEKLAAAAPENERAYVAALAARYSPDSRADPHQLEAQYARAMGRLSRRYPDDLDAATLYAEAMMNLNPWNFWSRDGKPAPGTEQIVAVLESVLRRDPSHVGANHFYIHTLEASPHPEHALPSAMRVGKLAPAEGHLVHMPAHIFIRTGFYARAVKANEEAIAADRAYIAASGAQGEYPVMYYSHNLHFLAFACMMDGRSREAMDAVAALLENVRLHLREMPMAASFLPVQEFVLARFNRWSEILALPDPGANLPSVRAAWHYARGLAYARTEKIARAEAELEALEAADRRVSREEMWDGNRASDVLGVAEAALRARILAAKKDRPGAIAEWRKAVAAQDGLHYDEPPGWYYPVRESLGAALLADGQPAEAEKVFRADLAENPRNPRSLYGLWRSLEAQKRITDARWVHVQFERAWKDADVPLRLDDF